MDQCRIAGCPGHYEDKLKVYAARYRGQLFVIDHVPMEICDFCGDTLLAPETVQQLERLRDHPPQPSRMIPLYEYASRVEHSDERAPKSAAVAD